MSLTDRVLAIFEKRSLTQHEVELAWWLLESDHAKQVAFLEEQLEAERTESANRWVVINAKHNIIEDQSVCIAKMREALENTSNICKDDAKHVAQLQARITELEEQLQAAMKLDAADIMFTGE